MTLGRVRALSSALAVGLASCSLFVSLDGYVGQGDASLDANAPTDAVNDVANDIADAGGDGCTISTTFYAAGAANPTNGCQSCQPTVSASGWSSINDGTTCDAGVCVAGKCGTCKTTPYEPPQSAVETLLGSTSCWYCYGTTGTTCCDPGSLHAGIASNAGSVRCDFSGDTLSQAIDVTGFFTSGQVPAGSLIQGIQVRIDKKESGTCTVKDAVVQLLYNGATFGSENKAVTTSCWPNAFFPSVYGCPSCAWGVTGLTYAKISDATFGVRLVANDVFSGSTSAYVDSISMAVTYCH